jgi:4-aminobutyrate aminotransferase-like enzyme
MRRAAGFEPHPRSAALQRWIRDHGAAAQPLVKPDPKSCGVLLDCSIGSLDLEGVDPRDAADFSRRVARHLEDVGSEVGIGRYDEPRSLYASDQFSAEGEEARERRTIHLGVDLFQPAGSPVFAPYAGKVHSFRDNDLPLDYGPTILLEHTTDVGPLYSLFGHLSRESLGGLEVGQEVAAGDQLATLGDIDVNGGWPPHLHFQWVVDPLGEVGNYPGVARQSLRSVWKSLSPDPSPTVGVDLRYRDRSTTSERLERRGKLLPPSMSLSYREPLTMVRGVGAYLFDEQANGYLDCVNNVCHVGHARREVVRAAARQMAVLNTNTRYLHDEILRYAERLLEWMPAPLEVCFLVNSGSEANELALRLARQATQKVGRIAIEAGYHGNTDSLIDVSSYKCEGAGGSGVPTGVVMMPLPDPFRGLYRDATSEGAMRYASHLDAAIVELESVGGAGSLLAEAWSGCGGQIVPPSGWLGELFNRARERGIVCIADEVQTGFGRIGTHRWAFEQQGATPDIVTLGKPIGNGHPLGAVVTTRSIAEAFDNGMEFFNTFGGNPVSCSVGNAVLDVLESDHLQQHAATVGEKLLKGFRALAAKHPAIGDVRGSGLFLGLEMVDEPAERRPSEVIASYVVERMKSFGILLSTDGPQHNVIKIKPPLVFCDQDADWLLHALARVLEEDWVQCRI